MIADMFFSQDVHDRFHDACEAIGVTPPALKALLSMEEGEAKPMRALASQWRCDAWREWFRQRCASQAVGDAVRSGGSCWRMCSGCRW